MYLGFDDYRVMSIFQTKAIFEFLKSIVMYGDQYIQFKEKKE